MAEYINRERLLELINEDCKYKNPTNEYTKGCNDVCDWAIKVIKNIPAADVQKVRHGKWILPRKKGCVTYDEVAYKECSECGEVTFLAKTKYSQMNYCPNCGAKMDA